MTERSFMERIVAILGVLVGTVVWVGRFLFSSLKDVLGRITGSDASVSSGAGEDDARDSVADSATSFAADLRSKGESLKDEAASLGQTVAATAREKVEQARDAAENLIHRDEEDSVDEDNADVPGNTDEFGKTGASAPELTSVQHGDVGGIPEAPAFAAAVGDTVSADSDTSSTEDEDVTGSCTGQMREGIPNLDEPGGDTGDVYGSGAGVLLDDHMPDGGYAGQMMQESDLGRDQGDEGTGLAEGEDILRDTELDRALDDDQSLSDDEIEYGIEETASPEDEDDTDDIPAASRGWRGAGADESVADDLYDDIGMTLSSDEIDYANDEVDKDDAAGMHIVDSPDESFVVEDSSPGQPIGFADEGGDPVFDTAVGETRSIDADDFAADALGNRMGGDAASGDLGPSQSSDDATWDPGSSEPAYDIQGTFDGSGVDEFDSDEVARDMLDDVGAADTGTTAPETSGGDAGNETGSVAWASSSGVIQEEFSKPLSPDELQGSGEGSPDTDVLADAGEPGLTEKDAGWRDAASQVAEQLDSEMGDSGVGSSGTTLSGAGQSAGAMTSDDAVAEGDGVGEMTSDTGSFATGGTTAPEAGDDEDQNTSGEGGSRDSMGVESDPGITEVLPDRAYQESVGYETLQSDKDVPRDSGQHAFANPGGPSGDSPMIGQAMTTGGSVADESAAGTGNRQGRSGGRQGKVPAGAVRGDGSGACPAEFPIKGNANSRIYHRPSDSSYESTIPEFCFATEADAKSAGFRARKG